MALIPATAAPMTEQIFLSYSRTDLPAAIALRHALTQAGFTVFKDDGSIRASDRWLDRLQEVLRGCSIFVVLIALRTNRRHAEHPG